MEALTAVFIGVVVVKIVASILFWRACVLMDRRRSGQMRGPREFPSCTPDEAMTALQQLIDAGAVEARAAGVVEKLVEEYGLEGEIPAVSSALNSAGLSMNAALSQPAFAGRLNALHRVRICACAARILAVNQEMALNAIVEQIRENRTGQEARC